MAAESAYTKFEPFRATEIWNEVLTEFRQKVPQIQPQRLKTKQNDENISLFSGSSAVKTLESYLTENRQKLGMKEITKEKVVKLCQILINEQIIEPYQSSNVAAEDKKFAPSEISLYRFCPKKYSESSQNFLFDENCVRMSPYRKTNQPPADVQRMWLTPNSCRTVGDRSPVSSRSNNNNWRSFLQTPTSNIFKSSEYCDTSRPYKSGAVSINSELVQSDDNELDGFDENVIYDLALFRLLTLVEIPVLDGILQFKSRRDHSKGGASLENLFASLGLSSSARKRPSGPNDQSEISKLADPWLIYGCTFLQELSSLNFIDFNHTESNHEKRIYVYRKIVDTTKKFYKDEPFFPAHYDEVLKEIFDLLTKKRFTLALEACQYFILLLSNEQRRRFHFLLTFLYYCSMNRETRLSVEMPNTQLVLQNLRECIVKCHSLSKTNVLQFLDFIVGNCRQVLKPPEGFQGQLFQRQFRQMYTVAEPDPGISYCQRITAAQFEQQKGEVSESALVQLVSTVVDDLTMSLPQKIEWLDKFKREYPELYTRRFSTLRW